MKEFPLWIILKIEKLVKVVLTLTSEINLVDSGIDLSLKQMPLMKPEE